MRSWLLALLFLPSVGLAQSGGGFDLSHNVIAGGGATFSTGGDYALGGTIGQPAAGTLRGGAFVLSGGFWSVPLAVAPTPTATKTTVGNTATPTAPTPPSVTPIASATPTPTNGVPPVTPTSTPTTRPTPSGTVVESVTATPTATATPNASCVGDCGGDGAVTVNELLVMVNVALDNATVSACEAGDKNQDGAITIDEILLAVNNALTGCGP